MEVNDLSQLQVEVEAMEVDLQAASRFNGAEGEDVDMLVKDPGELSRSPGNSPAPNSSISQLLLKCRPD